MIAYARLSAGDPAPGVTLRSPANPRFALDTSAGRYLALAFLPGATSPEGQAVLAAVTARRGLFDDRFASFFAVTADPADEAAERPGNCVPGLRCLWDGDLQAARLYGAAPAEGAGPYRARWVLIDPTMRMIEVAVLSAEPRVAEAALDRLERLPPPDRFAGVELQAPILFLPRVFEPALCARLIACYEEQGGEVSGFMRAEGGKTVGVHDTRYKSRRDAYVTDPDLRQPDGALPCRLLRRGRGRPLFAPPRQHHARHGAPAVRDLNQPQRRLRGRRGELSRIRAARVRLPALRL
ncbi:MAG: peroxiredoxin family protein [Rhodobacteraceae bacterium]|nr:peroxiredoxin family protein [Paracoccaceae bacterium]